MRAWFWKPFVVVLVAWEPSGILAAEDPQVKVSRLARELAEQQRRYGQIDRRVQEVRTELADTYVEIGETGKACDLYKKIVEVYTRKPPADYTTSLKASVQLATLLGAMEQRKKARGIYQSVVRELSRRLPADDGYLLWVEHRLAMTMHELEDFEHAYPLYKRVYEAYRRKHGERSLETLGVAANYGAAAIEIGKHEEGCALLEKIVETLEKERPSERDLLDHTRHNLAVGYGRLCRHEKAVEIEEALLKALLERPGSHELELAVRLNLSESALMLGKLNKARLHAEKVVEMASRDRKRYGGELAQARKLLAKIQSAGGKKKDRGRTADEKPAEKTAGLPLPSYRHPG